MAPYCTRCNRYFPHFSALRQHERNSSSHHICDDCEMDFSTWIGLKEHYVQSRAHHYCQHCDEHFDYADELEEHLETSHHYCGRCRRVFRNETGLHEHYRQSDAHHYCVSCRRDFASANNLNAHLNSSTHRPKDIVCPGRDCGQGFVSRAALVSHLESGKCASGANRHSVNRLVRQYDTQNIITDPARMLTAGSGPGSAFGGTKLIATAATWNGDAYECYLCHAGFRSLAHLNQHLASPRHEDKIYVCPLSTCRSRFGTLSGLWQHVESERCGVARFTAVRNAMDQLVGNVRRLTEH